MEEILVLLETISQYFKRMSESLSQLGKPKTQPLAENLIGKNVICRCYYGGLHYGKLLEVSDDYRACVLEKSGRIHEWDGAISVSKISRDGVTNGQIDESFASVLLTDVYEFVEMSDKALASLNSFRVK